MHLSFGSTFCALDIKLTISTRRSRRRIYLLSLAPLRFNSATGAHDYHGIALCRLRSSFYRAVEPLTLESLVVVEMHRLLWVCATFAAPCSDGLVAPSQPPPPSRCATSSLRAEVNTRRLYKPPVTADRTAGVAGPHHHLVAVCRANPEPKKLRVILWRENGPSGDFTRLASPLRCGKAIETTDYVFAYIGT